MGEKVKGGLMITDSADWTDVRRRTVEGNAKLFTHCQLKEVFIKLKQVSGINRKLKKKNIYPQMTHMDTYGGPQADFVGEQGLINDD